jgi:hypothetical protein
MHQCNVHQCNATYNVQSPVNPLTRTDIIYEPLENPNMQNVECENRQSKRSEYTITVAFVSGIVHLIYSLTGFFLLLILSQAE